MPVETQALASESETMVPATYVRYSDTVETKQPDEDETIAEIDALMQRIGAIMVDRFRHALRPVHAKSHGLILADMEVLDTLQEPLRQGLFARPGTYPVIIRLSTNPGDILPDSVSTPRGMALKVMNVHGAEMLPEHVGGTAQDFVFANGKAFASKDAKAFLEQQKLIEKHAGDSPTLKQVVSDAARGANAVLTALGHENAKLEGLGYPKTHILSETFGSLAPLRYGEYIAKLTVVPVSENLKALDGEHLHTRGQYSALKEAVEEFFQDQTAVWEMRVQLCTNLETMPVEDAAQEWPEDESPYITVARITAKPQETYSPERRVYVDDTLSFTPWRALAAHRPLGSINRSRKPAYAEAAKFRARMNAITLSEPDSGMDIPA